MINENILEMRGISKTFPGIKALDTVDFKLRKGEVHALLGENGAGKSTLMKILLGIYKPDSGEIYYKGEKRNFKNPHDALNCGISMIHQEISLVPTFNASENIWLGREDRFKKHGLINRNLRNIETNKLLKELGINIDFNEKVSKLSIAQMQMVEIIRAVSYNSDVVIMDEPTSALTSPEIKVLFDIIKRLAGKGVSIIYISHKMEEIFEICDNVTILRDGKYVDTKNVKEVNEKELVQLIVGRQLNDMFPKRKVEIGETVLKVKNLAKNGVFKDINFELKKGEILGLYGLMGAGRTEIARAIFGIDNYDSGEIYLFGEKVIIRSPKDAINLGIGMVTEDRLRSGAIHCMSIRTNMTIAYLREISNSFNFYNFKKEKDDFLNMAKKINLKYSFPEQQIASLSGGNQQKAIIGRWLLCNPKILILDEPTRGIDVGSKSEIHSIIGELVEHGVSIILISSEMPELLGVSDRILVIRGGGIVYDGDISEVNQEILAAQAFGVNSSENRYGGCNCG